MSLNLAHQALQLFDEDFVSLSSTKSKKHKLKKLKKKPNLQKPEDKAVEEKAEQLLRSTLVSRLKTPKIFDKVIKQQQNRQSSISRHQLRRSCPDLKTSSSVIASSKFLAIPKENQEKPVEEKNKDTVFTEEDFQRFFASYKPSADKK
jgi:hypothetical protein